MVQSILDAARTLSAVAKRIYPSRAAIVTGNKFARYRPRGSASRRRVEGWYYHRAVKIYCPGRFSVLLSGLESDLLVRLLRPVQGNSISRRFPSPLYTCGVALTIMLKMNPRLSSGTPRHPSSCSTRPRDRGCSR